MTIHLLNGLPVAVHGYIRQFAVDHPEVQTVAEHAWLDWFESNQLI